MVIGSLEVEGTGYYMFILNTVGIDNFITVYFQTLFKPYLVSMIKDKRVCVPHLSLWDSVRMC